MHNFSRACALEVERLDRVYLLVMLGAISVGAILLDERSSSLTLYLVESIIKKLCWVFLPMRVSQDKLLSCLCHWLSFS